tara:strand:+ start:258 stop:362 length:105 start_codon:yes stop_codon:yes gene_type:complete
MAIGRSQMKKQIETPPGKKRKIVRGRNNSKKRVG